MSLNRTNPGHSFSSGKEKRGGARFFVDSPCQAFPETSRFRVNDPDIVLHPKFGHRSECSANGLMLASCPFHPGDIESAELRLAVWGGHPGTTSKRFSLNGKGSYDLPPDGAEDGQCAYTFPVLSLDPRHLVEGTNALLFSCDKGSSFWGHFIVDEAILRIFPKRASVIGSPADFGYAVGDHSILPRLACRLDEESENLHVELRPGDIPESGIERVDFFLACLDYDESGSGGFSELADIGGRDGRDGHDGALSCGADDFHGFPVPGAYRGHAGTASSSPYAADFSLLMLPDQSGPMRLKAELRFPGGSGLVVDGPADIPFPTRPHSSVILCAATEMPRPFWSRAGNRLEAAIATADAMAESMAEESAGMDSSRAPLPVRAELIAKVWDGGRGSIVHPVELNGFPVEIAGSGRHDFIFSRVPIDPEILVPGNQRISLLSDTEHHGIEFPLPGPALVLRFEI